MIVISWAGRKIRNHAKHVAWEQSRRSVNLSILPTLNDTFETSLRKRLSARSWCSGTWLFSTESASFPSFLEKIQHVQTFRILLLLPLPSRFLPFFRAAWNDNVHSNIGNAAALPISNFSKMGNWLSRFTWIRVGAFALLRDLLRVTKWKRQDQNIRIGSVT